MDYHSIQVWVVDCLRPTPDSPPGSYANLLLRVSLGLLIFLIHGVHKVGGAVAYLSRRQPWPLLEEVAAIHAPFPFASALAASLVQLVGGALLTLGLLTRPAAIALACTLGVAIYQNVATRRDPQLAILYVIGLITLALWGGGSYSLDACIWPIATRL